MQMKVSKNKALNLGKGLKLKLKSLNIFCSLNEDQVPYLGLIIQLKKPGRFRV